MEKKEREQFNVLKIVHYSTSQWNLFAILQQEEAEG